MELRPLSRREPVLRRFVAELWLPYHRELEATVDAHALAEVPDEDLVDANVDFYRDLLAEDDRRGWVAVERTAADASDDETAIDRGSPDSPDLTDSARSLVGFLLTSVDACPAVFDRPDRLVVGDIYVTDPYRGSGLAERLMRRAVADARDQDCRELRLDVDVDNDRATAFYDRCGFEPFRRQLTADAGAVAERLDRGD